VTNHLRDVDFPFESVFQWNQGLRFLLPVRNPLDCAVSNIKTGHVRYIDAQDRKSRKLSVTRERLGEFRWFLELETRFPARFFHYFGYELTRERLINLAMFLQLEPTQTWLDKSLEIYDIHSNYQHDGEMISAYQNLVGEMFQLVFLQIFRR